MASYNYMTSKDTTKFRRNVDVVQLMNKAKVERQKEKKKNMYIVAATVSALAVSGLIISL